MLEFHLDKSTGVAPYLQPVQQTRQGISLGILTRGDQLPTVREVATRLGINRNTVFRAYRALQRDRLVRCYRAKGTFVLKSLTNAPIPDFGVLHQELGEWLREGYVAGLDDEGIMALVAQTLREVGQNYAVP